jgi:hypothetical protein
MSQNSKEKSKGQSLLYDIDMFSDNIIFTFNGESALKTKTGVAATFLLLAIGIFMFMLMGRSFFFKTDPLSLYSSQVLDKVAFLDTSTNKKMFLAFRIKTTSKSLPINGGYFTATATIFRPNKGSNTFNSIMPLIECEKMAGFDKAYMENLGILRNNFYCLPLTQTNFGGDLRDLEYNYIQVSIMVCTSLDPKCNAGLASVFNNGTSALFLDTYYPQVFYNPKQYDGAFKIQHVPVTDKYQYQAVVDREMYFMQSLFNDDRGWLLKDIQKTLLYSVHNTVATRGVKPATELTLFRNFVYVSGFYEEYSRTYQKLQDVIAVVGGFIGICRILLRMLLFTHTKYTKSEYLLNDLIKFRKANNNNNLFMAKNDIKSILQETPAKLTINKFTTNNNALSNNGHREEEKDNSQLDLNELPNKLVSGGKQLTNINNIKFKLSTGEILKKTLCKKCIRGKQLKRVEIFDLVYDYIKNTLDINKYFDAVYELKNIKSAIFNNSQRKSFNFFEKPTVVIGDMDDKTIKDIETSLFEKGVNVNDDRVKLVEYFAYRLYNKTATSVDNKLLELLDGETTSMVIKRLNEVKSVSSKGKSPVFEFNLLNADDN